ncbi:DUF4185 domain-containing protein [Cohnella herbarum]|uniref:DUF4185 domain-containing protein n=2 Tax=Cohnella herbarum TaxID=2728023 RepID=A0A7Z2VSK7_9BACL|nr:DUF4185 domain-containing protein [Cohnella herbarum]
MLDAKEKTFILKGISDLTQVSQLTGADSPNKTDQYGVYGTDLGSMINADDRTYFVFGDTFGERPPDMIGGGGSYWRSNTIAYSTDNDPTDGITLDGMVSDEIGLAKELIPSAKVDYEEMTTIPTHGLYANGALYLYYMSVNHWGDPGKWDANDSSVAKSTDQGHNWTLLDDLKWPGDSNFIQVSPYKVKIDDEQTDIYFWCIPSGRFGGVQLMKVSEKNVENPAEYRYFAGLDEKEAPIWSEEMAKAKTIVEDSVGELSVVWNPYLERWLMTYLNEGNGVVIREGITPWGPWGDKLELVSASDYPGLYAPFMNDKYIADGGKNFYFSMSLWDPYNVFWFKATLDK